jgi:hypothetical protein
MLVFVTFMVDEAASLILLYVNTTEHVNVVVNIPPSYPAAPEFSP